MKGNDFNVKSLSDKALISVISGAALKNGLAGGISEVFQKT